MCSVAPSSAVKIRSSRFGELTRLVVGAVRVLQRDLPVVGAVAIRNGTVIFSTTPSRWTPVGELDELVQVGVPPHPQHVLPVVGHRPLALALEPPALHRAPVVVGAPGNAQGEPLLERGGAGRVVAAQRPARRCRSGRGRSRCA